MLSQFAGGLSGLFAGAGGLAFATPWILTALAALPVIYWLLRVTPPSPRRNLFSGKASRMLRDLIAREETPDRTPWWLLALRLLIAALIILGLARPVLNPGEALPGGGPLLIVIDNGWAAARDWPARQTLMGDIADRAERTDRDIYLLTTAPDPSGDPVAVSGRLRPAEARGMMEALVPHPWPTDRAAAARAVTEAALPPSGYAVWLSDGLAGEGDDTLMERLQRFGGLEMVLPDEGEAARLLRPPENEGEDLLVPILRASDGAGSAAVRVLAEDGRLIGREVVSFQPGERQGQARFTLPTELRNEAARIDVDGETTAGAVVLLDERWRRRPVGIAAAATQGETQPLLSDTHYVERALAPFSDIRFGTIEELILGGIAVLVLPDTGALSEEETALLQGWMNEGGVVLRFAGPLMAANPDQLLPVSLRMGDRTLSGALSWTEPMPLAPFPDTGPFADLEPPGDVRIERQVLAEPTLDLAGRTWARLTDGTPLVTGEARGEGWLVLFHVTAGPEWSNLPLSGLFVEMLRAVVGLSEGSAAVSEGRTLEPYRTLDGFGRLQAPPPTALPVASDDIVGPRHPPGFYGTEDARTAINLGAGIDAPAPLSGFPSGVALGGYEARGEVPLLPWLLAAAMALVAIDLVIALGLRGLLTPARRSAAAIALLAALAGLPVTDARAQGDEQFALQAATGLYLAYVETGVPEVDRTSEAGLETLSEVLRARTAVEADGAMAVDPETDELAFFPLIYWPVVAEQPDLSDEAIDRLNRYLATGGTILFDTRDRGGDAFGGGEGTRRLRTLIEGLDVPALTPVPPDHVLTKSFYLMQEFPGRYEGGEVWVENTSETINDGVSSVIIGGNDWAAAWARGESGLPLYPVVPGGERQREMAYRFGVNLVMYALTGNYKADQVHVPAILERLGQ